MKDKELFSIADKLIHPDGSQISCFPIFNRFNDLEFLTNNIEKSVGIGRYYGIRTLNEEGKYIPVGNWYYYHSTTQTQPPTRVFSFDEKGLKDGLQVQRQSISLYQIDVYKKGERVRTCVISSRVYKDINYRNGLRHGTYYSRGLVSGQYVNGKREGRWEFLYSGGGALAEVANYKNGKLSGLVTYYYNDWNESDNYVNSPAVRMTFKNNSPHGWAYYWSMGGKLLRKRFYINGILYRNIKLADPSDADSPYYCQSMRIKSELAEGIGDNFDTVNMFEIENNGLDELYDNLLKKEANYVILPTSNS